jgi:gluconate 2-dehydrogenase gamma chain
MLGGSVAVGMSLLLWLSDKDTSPRLYSKDVQVLLQTAYQLFPHSKLGPGAVDLHISAYLSYVLQDERIMEEERHYLLKGASWLEESAHERYSKSFLSLTVDEKEQLLLDISKESWGERFIYRVLNHILEALLSAPVYGSNVKEIGWKWLEHNPGFPQPSRKKEISYGI